jgi:hypothetical protein
MRYLLFLIAPVYCFCQTYANPYTPPQKVEVTVKQDPYANLGNSFAQGMQAGAAARAARAREGQAQSEAMKNNYKEIRVDKIINNDGLYKAVVLNNVSGWKPSANKSTIKKILKGSTKYRFYDSPNKLPESFKNSNEVLYLNWIREAVTQYDRVTTLILSDNNGNTLYEATHKNIPYSEMLSILTTSYFMSSESAIKKVKELKELLDLGILSQLEYDKETETLKKIILSN